MGRTSGFTFTYLDSILRWRKVSLAQNHIDKYLTFELSDIHKGYAHYYHSHFLRQKMGRCQKIYMNWRGEDGKVKGSKEKIKTMEHEYINNLNNLRLFGNFRISFLFLILDQHHCARQGFSMEDFLPPNRSAIFIQSVSRLNNIRRREAVVDALWVPKPSEELPFLGFSFFFVLVFFYLSSTWGGFEKNLISEGGASVSLFLGYGTCILYLFFYCWA